MFIRIAYRLIIEAKYTIGVEIASMFYLKEEFELC